MTALILPSRGCTSQPQGYTIVNRENPITKDLVDTVLPIQGATAKGLRFTPTTGVYIQRLTKSLGPVLACSQNDNNGGSFILIPGAWAPPPPYTAHSLFYAGATSIYQYGVGNALAGNSGGWKFMVTNNKLSVTVTWSGGGAGVTATHGPDITLNVPILVTVVVKVGTFDLYVNGELSIAGTAHSAMGVPNMYVVPFFDNNITYGNVSGVYNLSVWKRALTALEIKALYQNPWQIFSPIERQIWVGIPASGGESIGDLASIESGADIAAFAGTAVSTFYASLTAVESGSDIAALAGMSLSQGSLVVTESGSDIAAFVAKSLAQGTLAITESGSDIAAFVAKSLAQGTLTVTESGTDIAAFTGSQQTTGTLAAIESGSDIAAFVAKSLSQGFLTAVESGSDIAAFVAKSLAQGSLSVTESGSDTAAFTGSQQTIGILAAIESGSDIAVFVAKALSQGLIATTESGSDIAAFIAKSLAQGSLSVTEAGSDIAAFTGSQQTTGTLTATESGVDTASLVAKTLSQGSLATTESGSDTLAISGSVYVVGTLISSESGSDTASFVGGNPAFYVPSLRRMTSASRSSTLSPSLSRAVTFNSSSRSVSFTSPSRSIILQTSPSRTVAFSSAERSEI